MTPEQLEAHRVRFELQHTHSQGYSADFLVSCRKGDGYTKREMSAGWQAYQWALTAHNVQRLGCKGVSLPPLITC